MTESEFTHLRVRTDEKEYLLQAMEEKFQDANRISYGGMIRLLADDVLESEEK